MNYPGWKEDGMVPKRKPKFHNQKEEGPQSKLCRNDHCTRDWSRLMTLTLDDLLWTEEVGASRALMPHSDIFILLPSEPESFNQKQ